MLAVDLVSVRSILVGASNKKEMSPKFTLGQT